MGGRRESAGGIGHARPGDSGDVYECQRSGRQGPASQTPAAYRHLVPDRPGDGAGGHNGVRSIIEELGTGAFPRVRIGIGRPPAGQDPAEFVLERFTSEERPKIDEAIDRAAEAVVVAATEGLAAAMNRYNRRPPGSLDPPARAPNQSGAKSTQRLPPAGQRLNTP